MPNGVKHSPATKTQALALILCGESVSETARVLELPRQTVQQWYAELSREEFVKVRQAQRERIEELAVSHVGVLFGSMDNAAGQLGERDYLKRFPPTQVADAYDKLRIGVASVLSTILATPAADSGDSEPEEEADGEQQGDEEPKAEAAIERYEDNSSTAAPAQRTEQD